MYPKEACQGKSALSSEAGGWGQAFELGSGAWPRANSGKSSGRATLPYTEGGAEPLGVSFGKGCGG
jgi:hypothetical protein